VRVIIFMLFLPAITSSLQYEQVVLKFSLMNSSDILT
jgi:hypothetical protein